MAAAASQDTRPRIAVADLEDFIRRAFEAAEYSELSSRTNQDDWALVRDAMWPPR